MKLKRAIASLPAAKAGAVRRLVEAGYIDDGADAGGDGANQALAAALEAACVAVVKKALSGGMDAKDALAKLREVFAVASKLDLGAADDDEALGDEDDDEDGLTGKRGPAAEHRTGHALREAVRAGRPVGKLSDEQFLDIIRG